ncbi:MAG: YbaB/EbfC family nucleoid-associated protein [Acidimicrobiales bacterium]|jgi:DNA-binding YbaB/EbfC family protein
MASDEDETATADDAGGDEEAEETRQQGASLDGLLAQLEVVSEQLDDVAQEASDVIVQGSSAGGSVVVQLTGGLEAVSIRIDPALVDPSDVAMLEDAVLAALRDGLAQVVELQSELADELESTEIDLSSLLGKLGGLASFGGLGLPDLGDLGNPEDLIAGLTGALGNLPASLGGSLPAGLNDIMAGLGLSNAPAAGPSGDGEPRARQPGAASESPEEPEGTDDDGPES